MGTVGTQDKISQREANRFRRIPVDLSRKGWNKVAWRRSGELRDGGLNFVWVAVGDVTKSRDQD